MVTVFFIFYGFCLFLSVITFITGIFAFKKLRKRFNILPKNLKIYLLTCALPFTVSLNLSTIFLTIVYLINENEKVFAFEIVKQIVAFSSQQIRNSLFVIVIERVFATIRFKKYNLSSKGSQIFWWLLSYTYISSTLYTVFSYAINYTPWFRTIFGSFGLLPIWIMFVTHLSTLIMCPILHYLNRRMYNKFAYQIGLQSRYQIFENIKVLSFIFPSIVIYTILAPLGAFLRIVLPSNFYSSYVPYCSYLTFYQLGILLIIIQQIYGKKGESDSTKTAANISTVTNAFGKHLPAVVSNDKYFKELKQQWI